MTFHALHVAILLWVLALAWRLVVSVRRGVLRFGRDDYTRAARPVEYWFGLLFEAALLLALLCYAYDLATEGEGLRPKPFLLLLGAYSLFWLIRSLQTGSAGLGSTAVDRRDRSGPYWGFLAFQLAFTSGLFWLALSLGPAERNDKQQEAYEVVDAVRERVPQAGKAAFANVRTDARSGFVCGQFSGRDAKHRFFGTTAHGEAAVTVEEAGASGFESRYGRLCGGAWVLPRSS